MMRSVTVSTRLALAFIAGVALAFTSAQDAAATFTPSANYSLSNSAANGDADTMFTYSVSGPGEERTDFVSIGARVEAAVAPGPGGAGFIPGTHPALGDIAVDVQASWTLALAGGACNNPIFATFRPLNATVNNSAGNLVYPSLPSEENAEGKMSPLIRDTYTVSPGAGSAGPGSASPPPVNGLPAFVERYPSYLNTILDTDNGPGVSPLAPLARYAGGALLAGVAVTFDILVFEQGAMAAFTPPHPLENAPDNSGYLQLVVVNGRLPFSSSVTNQCQPESYSITLFGASRTNPCNGNTASPCNTTSGINFPAIGAATATDRYRNPVLVAPLQWLTWAKSVVGNEAIVVQDIPVTAGTTATDSEGDGIHDGIDGTFQSFSFLNRSMVASTTFTDQHFGGATFGQVTSSVGATYTISDDPAGVRITHTAGSGAMTVSMCGGQSTLTLTPGDDVIATCSSVTVQVLTGPVTETFGTITATLPVGTSSTVSDLGGGSYQVTNSAGSSASITAGGLSVTPGETVTVMDSDGDGRVDQADNCPTFATAWIVPAGDDDCDGFTTANENQVGTMTGDRCAATGVVTGPPGANDEPPPDAWPVDFNDNQIANTIDVGFFVPRLNSVSPGPPYEIRYDLTFNGVINTIDVGRFVPFLNKSCTP